MSISEAESAVMQVLWSTHPLSAQEIVERVAAPNDWTDVTVRSLLNRLLKKGALSAVRDGRKYLYSPVLSREEYVDTESRGLLDRLFDGQLAPLVSHFSEREALSPEDVRAL